MRRHVTLAAMMAACILSACGGSATDPEDGGGGRNDGDPNGVTVSNNVFEPNVLAIAQGTRVTWSWAEGSSSHTVTFDDGVTSDKMTSGTFSRTFNATGTFPYHCKVHGQSMSGTITVQ